MVLDWGIAPSVQLLTKGRVEPLELYGYEAAPGDAYLNRIYPEVIKLPSPQFVFHIASNALSWVT